MKRGGGGGEGEKRTSGTLPACRSNMKNDVCSRSDRRGRMDPVLHQTHYITFPTDAYLHTSDVHTHIAAVNHLLPKESYVTELSFKISVQHRSAVKIQGLKPHGTLLLCFQRITTKINHGDKSQESPGVLPQRASPQGADLFVSGGLTC